MNIKWSAVVIGFAVTLVLGMVSGLLYTGTGTSSVVVYWGVIGVLGGLTAGYLAAGTARSGALHGGIATVFGALILLAITAFTTLLFGGLVVSVSVLTLGLLMLAFHAIPGAVGGVLGSWARSRRATGEITATKA
ncbi:hypothetical protein SAMN06269185_0166 [Natronoarchaeum philippinense]|uniref:DUF5518 domain-containing protein n=1 Tax=Natronoarchaeum philippinense TaxID=558529 RepID=A0A285N0L0_NATPI|nr:DUF5518 domain-containing protein [Natronoarchaeum philippinense]SNZ02995.1 hypothetical protein SAMN06269185_0166 [Natronoarchaeum philippinense]